MFSSPSPSRVVVSILDERTSGGSTRCLTASAELLVDAPKNGSSPESVSDSEVFTGAMAGLHSRSKNHHPHHLR